MSEEDEISREMRIKKLQRVIQRFARDQIGEARKQCRCKVCGLSVFYATADLSVSPYGIGKTCRCARVFNPSEFTFCPRGDLYVSEEVVE